MKMPTEVQDLVEWCASNNLILNTQKTKELIIGGLRKATHTLTFILMGLKWNE